MKQDFGRKTKELGQYYTPSSIVNFIIENTVGKLLEHTDIDFCSEITVLDPSVGQGVFLIGAKNYLETFHLQYNPKLKNTLDVDRHIIVNNLYGIDIDTKQVNHSRNVLGLPNFIGNIKQFDTLVPSPDIGEIRTEKTSLIDLRRVYREVFLDNDLKSIKRIENQILQVERNIRKNALKIFNGEENTVFPVAWEEIFPETGGKFHVIIGNPPWGADISLIKNGLSYLKSATGQMDSWSLFIERCLLGLREDGYFGFVVPNTLLLNPNFTEIRSILLATCQITHLINLGEGLFPGVSQPAMIVIARKTCNKPSHKITVIPNVTKQVREEILNGSSSITLNSSLSCLQSRFNNNKNKEFDIFSLKSDDFVKIVEKDLYSNQKEVSNLGTLVDNGRGVEIGKKGRIVQCPLCKRWNSPPQTKRKCKGTTCSYILSSADKEIEIVYDSTKYSSLERPFLVGFHIQRYFTHPHKYINIQYSGINYKTPKLYQSPKLLVRKTGKGMNWVIDYQNRWVSQVVYVFQLKEDLNRNLGQISLEYLLGILNSRMMKKYVNSKVLDPTRTEFPHFVQKSLLQLPIKIPLSDQELKLSKVIHEKASKLQLLYQQHNEEGLTAKRLTILKEEIKKYEEEMEKAVKSIYSVIS